MQKELQNLNKEDKSKDNSESDIKIGTIVTFQSHPYQAGKTNIKIATYANYTPPLMVVTELSNNNSYDALTGKKNKRQYKCLFYSHKSGSFETNWFKSNEIKYISSGNSVLNELHKRKPIDEIKYELIEKQVILSTIKIELEKKQIWTDITDKRQKLKESNLLDYLPPVATVLDVKYEEGHKKYSERSGNLQNEKAKILVKLRWLNNHTGKFSEDYVPIDALEEVLFNANTITYNGSKSYLYSKKVKLEDNELVALKAIPLVYSYTIFSHYFYVYYFKNIWSQSESKIRNQESVKLFDYDGFFKDLPYVDDKIFDFFNVGKISELKGGWFEIKYKDRVGKFTTRIINFQNFIDNENPQSEDKSKVFKANCLLRNGKIRHFRIEGIISYRRMKQEFVNTFVEENKD